MRLVSIEKLVERARRAADMENSAFVTEPEAIDRMNTAIAELYDLLIAAYGEDYTYLTVTASFTANLAEYPLPNDFYKLAGVDIETNASTAEFITARRANEEHRNLVNRGASTWLRYFLRGPDLVFTPAPKNTRQYRIRYHPVAPVLIKTEVLDAAINTGTDEITLTDHGLSANHPVRFTTDGALPAGLLTNRTYYVIVVDQDTVQVSATRDGSAVDLTAAGTGPHTILSMFDGVNGWEEFAVLDVAIFMADKEETDSRSLQRRKDRQEQRLIAMTENRDEGEPLMIRDVYGGPGLFEDGTGIVGGIRWPPPA